MNTRQWFTEQIRRLASLSGDPSTVADEHFDSRLRVLEEAVSAILGRLDEMERE